jgi:hypothetical protein
LRAAVTEAVSADIDRFVTDTAAAWAMPGQALALVEAAARDTANRVGLAMIQLTLTLTGEPSLAPAACGHRLRLTGARARTVRTALGPARYTRSWWQCDTCHTGSAPADRWWGITDAGHTVGYDKILALAGADHPYRASATLITELCRIDLASPASIARTTRHVGVAARDRVDAETATIRAGTLSHLPSGPAPEVGYLLIDGTGAPMVPKETTGRAGKYPDGRARTREVKIGCLFTQAAATPGGQPARDEGSASYIATFDDATSFAQHLRTEHTRHGFDRITQPIVIGDGAKWIWTIAERLFPEATHIVDYWHAREHVHDLVKIFDHLLSDPAAFTHQLIGHLDRGDITAIVDQVDALKLDTYRGTIGKQASTALACFNTNTHRMQYHHYRAQGWFIGSGPVEAACKTIVAQRAKQAGMRWTLAGLDPLLTLRTLTRSGRDHLIWNHDQPQTPDTPSVSSMTTNLTRTPSLSRARGLSEPPGIPVVRCCHVEGEP